MTVPLVTPTGGDDLDGRSATNEPIAILFNDRAGPGLVADIILLKHAFVAFEVYETVDEQGRSAFLLLIDCETANAEQLLELVGSRLPDYIQSRRFPPSRVDAVKSTGTRLA